MTQLCILAKTSTEYERRLARINFLGTCWLHAVEGLGGCSKKNPPVNDGGVPIRFVVFGKIRI